METLAFGKAAYLSRQELVFDELNHYLNASAIGTSTTDNPGLGRSSSLPEAVNPTLSASDSATTGNDNISHRTPEFLDNTNPTPPPSGYSSKAVPKDSEPSALPVKPSIEKMFERFHQSPNGDFKPMSYNPFEVKHRRRTSKAQFKVLERAFMQNCKPSSSTRRILAAELSMTTRAIQVWFQNRRAKLKNQVSSGLDPEIVQAGITLAGYHIEAGARSFAAYTKAMIADLGEAECDGPACLPLLPAQAHDEQRNGGEVTALPCASPSRCQLNTSCHKRPCTSANA